MMKMGVMMVREPQCGQQDHSASVVKGHAGSVEAIVSGTGTFNSFAKAIKVKNFAGGIFLSSEE